MGREGGAVGPITNSCADMTCFCVRGEHDFTQTNYFSDKLGFGRVCRELDTGAIGSS